MALTIAAVLIASTVAAQVPSVAAAAESTVTVSHTQTTTERGTPNLSYYWCPDRSKWDRYSRSTYGPGGCSVEVVFSGHTLDVLGDTRVGHGTADVFIDDALVGTIDYGSSTNTTVRPLLTKTGLTDATHTLRLEARGNGADFGGVRVVSGQPDAPVETDELDEVVAKAAALVAADYAAAGWPSFAAALEAAEAVAASETAAVAERQNAADAVQDAIGSLVLIRGLRELPEYQTRVPSDFTPETWAAFVDARQAATATLADADATSGEVVAAKNALQSAASDLVTVSQGAFEKITNNTGRSQGSIREWKDIGVHSVTCSTNR